MAFHSKAIKISDKAYTALRKELGSRMNSDNDRIKFKDVASDLIIAGFELKKDTSNLENLTVQYILSIKKWENDYDLEIVEQVAHIVYWEHIKLALSKGFTVKEAPEHVNYFLTQSSNKSNVIGTVENYLSSIDIHP